MLFFSKTHEKHLKLFTKADINFQKTVLVTDTSLMPTSSYETISYASFHPKDFREVYEAGNSNDYAAFYFRRSAITNNY